MSDLNELHSRREELRGELDRLDQEISQAKRIVEEQGSSSFSSPSSSADNRPAHLVQIAHSKRNVRRPWK